MVVVVCTQYQRSSRLLLLLLLFWRSKSSTPCAVQREIKRNQRLEQNVWRTSTKLSKIATTDGTSTRLLQHRSNALQTERMPTSADHWIQKHVQTLENGKNKKKKKKKKSGKNIPKLQIGHSHELSSSTNTTSPGSRSMDRADADRFSLEVLELFCNSSADCTGCETTARFI
jgi:hypothetical protein